MPPFVKVAVGLGEDLGGGVFFEIRLLCGERFLFRLQCKEESVVVVLPKMLAYLLVPGGPFRTPRVVGGAGRLVKVLVGVEVVQGEDGFLTRSGEAGCPVPDPISPVTKEVKRPAPVQSLALIFELDILEDRVGVGNVRHVGLAFDRRRLARLGLWPAGLRLDDYNGPQKLDRGLSLIS